MKGKTLLPLVMLKPRKGDVVGSKHGLPGMRAQR